MKRIKLFSILVPCMVCAVHGQNLKFDKLMVQDGLTSINSILIDSDGFSWIGGTHGLYRFDGTDFTSFVHNPTDSSSLSSDRIISLFEDSHGNIWIGTENNGVNLYSRRFESIKRLKSNDLMLNQSSISTIIESSAGNIWIGTMGYGIFVIDSMYQIVARYYHDDQKPSSLSNNTIFDFLIDHQNQMWVSTNSGKLDLFSGQSFGHYTFSDKPLSGVRTGQRMVEDNEGNIWIGTEGEGLFVFDQSNEKFAAYRVDSKSNTINNNVITDLLKDSKGNIWIATDGGGVSLFQSETDLFSHYQYDKENEFGLSNNASYSMAVDGNDRVWLGMGDGVVNISDYTPFNFLRPHNGLSFRVVVDLHLDSKGNLWAGTGGGGLDQFNRAMEQANNYATDTKPRIRSDVVLTVMEDHVGNIWAGTFLGGMLKIDPVNHKIHEYTKSHGLSNDHVFDIVQDLQGDLWIATQGGGLNQFNIKDEIFTHYTVTNGSGILNNRIQSLLVDSNNRLWIGFYNEGLQILDIETMEFLDIQNIIPDVLFTSIAKYPIHVLYENPFGHIWIGTGGLGLVKIIDKTKFEIFNKKKGLPSNSIYGIKVIDKNVWISTNQGIASVNLDSGIINIIDKNDGLLTNDFESGAIAHSSDDKLFFSSKEGVMYFDPDDLKSDIEEIIIAFTDLTVNNQKVIPGQLYDDVAILNRSVVSSEKIDLPFAYNNFSIFFNAPAFGKPAKLLYRYKLEGIQDEWIIDQSRRRYVSYSNLNDGSYRFDVQASLDGRSWSNSKSIDVFVHSPIYRTWYAYAFYALIAVIGALIIYRIIRIRLQLTNQLKFEKYTREKDNELNKQKISLFTGISHELRTPLTLLIGPLDQFVNNPNLNNRMRNQVLMMQKNANKLLHLINQLLDFRRMESGKMKLQVRQQDLVYFIEEILLTFRELALQKEIHIDFINDLISQSFYFDETKLEIIFYNLLSNAIKFTSPNGSVIVKVSSGSEKLGHFAIEIKDSGRGISPENLENIFEPFFREQASATDEKGTGIGLSLVKQVVNLHRGAINVSSIVNKGSSFLISFPGDIESYSNDEMVDVSMNGRSIKMKPEKPGYLKEGEELSSFPTLLIVEDNEDILEFIKDNLLSSFRVISELNGQLGLDRALETIPDIIISDIMMPEMDGIEMCRHIKSDIRTSHIPVILLTARSGFIHELSGLDTGADYYITKPFKIELLHARIINLLKNRDKLHEKIKKDLILEPSKIAVSDPDEKFLMKLMKLIEEHISDSDYSVKDLAHQMGVSHSVLYRKINALTNLTINQFIRSVRLKRATQLLISNAYSISEVGYMIGFSNPKYFSTCFKAEFGQSPSDFILKSKQQAS